jgi:hypothetical protein
MPTRGRKNWISHVLLDERVHGNRATWIARLPLRFGTANEDFWVICLIARPAGPQQSRAPRRDFDNYGNSS